MARQPISIMALGLWVVVGVLAGTLIAVLLHGTLRQIMFGVLVGGGIVGLIAIQLLAHRSAKPAKATAALANRALPQPPAPVLLAGPAQSASSAPVQPDKDPKVAAREWLDDFLVRQQQKE